MLQVPPGCGSGSYAYSSCQALMVSQDSLLILSNGLLKITCFQLCMGKIVYQVLASKEATD
jgi:hypothetical protein